MTALFAGIYAVCLVGELLTLHQWPEHKTALLFAVIGCLDVVAMVCTFVR